MKSIIVCSLALALGSVLMTSCASKQSTSGTASSSYSSSSKNVVNTRDTGPRQNN